MKKTEKILKIFSIVIALTFISPILITANCIEISKENNSNKIVKNNFIFDFKLKIIDKRFVLYNQPDTPPPENGYKTIFLFHGAGQHAFAWFLGFYMWSDAQTSFTKAALENNFFVVGLESKRPISFGPRGWDAFEKETTKNDDISYVKNVISWLENSSLPVNTNKIYAAGFSSGAFMCSRLAQSIGYRFKGVILNSGCNADSIELTNRGPVFNFSTGFNISTFHPPTLLVHGEKDMLVPIKGAESYYQDLTENNINVISLYDKSKGHIWLENYNEQILNWIKNN